MLTTHVDSVSSAGYKDHPDAPLPIVQTQPTRTHQYEDQPTSEHGYNCESGSEADQQQPLAQSEPRPIEDYEDAVAAATRPRHAWQVWWLRNKGMGLVLLAQMFAASMNVMTQVLEIHSAMHPFQVRNPRRKKKWLCHINLNSPS